MTKSEKQVHYEQKSHAYRAGSRRAQRVIDLVGGPGHHVLDVGCGAGHLGALLAERGNHVVGVELSAAAAEQARIRVSEVKVFDIESEWPVDLCGRTFDVVVLGEVLEHVFDPVGVLKQAARTLVPGGRAIITTPNFLVWIARLQILAGRFRYQQYGLFDFGHIRWFTYEYLREVVAQSGFALEEERHLAHPRRLDAFAARWPGLFAMNFVVSARVVG